MERFYYENKLSNQNITAKPNVAWVANIREFELVENKKLYVFLCADVHTNTIIAPIQAYAENDGYWLKLCQFGDDIDISVLNKLEEEHRKEWDED